MRGLALSKCPRKGALLALHSGGGPEGKEPAAEHTAGSRCSSLPDALSRRLSRDVSYQRPGRTDPVDPKPGRRLLSGGRVDHRRTRALARLGRLRRTGWRAPIHQRPGTRRMDPLADVVHPGDPGVLVVGADDFQFDPHSLLMTYQRLVVPPALLRDARLRSQGR